MIIKHFKYFLLLLFFAFTLKAYNQHYESPPNLPTYDRHLYHFGFILGINKMDYILKTKDDFHAFDSVRIIENQGKTGFTIGIVSSLRLGWDFADLRFVPSLSFGQSDLFYAFKPNSNNLKSEIKPAEIVKLEFPFLLKLKSERFANNARAYIISGAKFSMDLASQAKQKENTDIYVIRLNRNDFSLMLGTGLDFYLPFFKFGIELKMDYGLIDIIKRDNTVYTNSIEKLNSKMFLLSFTFE